MRKTPLFFTFALSFLFSACAAAPPFDETAWKDTVQNEDVKKLYAPHFDNGAYFNPWLPMEEKRFGRFLQWRLSKKADYTEEEKNFLPQVIPDLAQRIQALPDGDFIAWIGHGTFLLRTQGVFWITDPIFSKRALLPARVTPPAMTAADLESITDQVNVVISHNHYDHLDKATLQSLPRRSRLFVPLGLKEVIRDFFDGEIHEMDWWQEIDIGNGIRLICLPAQHWSRRIGQDFNASLWASYLLVTPEVSIYYGGDSGYFVGFREIGRHFPGIDYALMPLTAYHPRWFMHYAHVNAAESIQAFEDLKARFYIPTQWGTFQLGDNPPGFPALDLKRTLKNMNLDAYRFRIMDIGQIERIE